MTSDATHAIVRRAARPFEPTDDGLRPLVEAIGDAQVVLIGEATHGTHEFYLHIDHTTAIEPLERWARDEVDAPETYPTGL
jgi:erythromycin esterase-like protein